MKRITVSFNPGLTCVHDRYYLQLARAQHLQCSMEAVRWGLECILSVCMSVCLYVCMSVCLYVCLSAMEVESACHKHDLRKASLHSNSGKIVFYNPCLVHIYTIKVAL